MTVGDARKLRVRAARKVNGLMFGGGL